MLRLTPRRADAVSAGDDAADSRVDRGDSCDGGAEPGGVAGNVRGA